MSLTTFTAPLPVKLLRIWNNQTLVPSSVVFFQNDDIPLQILTHLQKAWKKMPQLTIDSLKKQCSCKDKCIQVKTKEKKKTLEF